MTTVCVGVKTFHVPHTGGVMWAFLNWALGFRALGCDVIWAEEVRPDEPPEQVAALAADVRERLAPFGLADRVGILPLGRNASRPPEVQGCLPFEAAVDADLFVNFAYALPQYVLDTFRRTAVIDIDPGLLQSWVSREEMSFGRYHRYFSVGETIGQPGSGIPDLGVTWHHTPPCVSLDWWPVVRAPADAPFTTVTQWWGDWMEDVVGHYENSKRAGFEPFLTLPSLTQEKVELAAPFGDGEHDERPRVIHHGWSVKAPSVVAASALAYQRYVQGSRGEFSCAKPSCVRMQNAWVSDRTICYLASGKPAVVQHTGPSGFLPDARGIFRFKTLQQAAAMLNAIGTDYERHCHDARALAAEHFDASRVVARVLDLALD